MWASGQTQASLNASSGSPRVAFHSVISHHEADTTMDPILRDTLRLLKNNFEVIRGEVTALDGHKTGTPRDTMLVIAVCGRLHDEGEPA